MEAQSETIYRNLYVVIIGQQQDLWRPIYMVQLEWLHQAPIEEGANKTGREGKKKSKR